MSSTLDVPPRMQSPPMLMPRVGPSTAARRHWWLVVLMALLFTAAGLAAAVRRQPVYTAEARLAAGRIDVGSPAALGSFTVATQALAAQYSRSIDGEGVTRRVAPAIRLTPNQVAARVSATPIPESPVIRVFGTGPNERSAIRLTNLTSNALIRYSTQLNRSNPDSARLLREFRNASADVLRLTQTVTLERDKRDASPSDATSASLQQAQVALEVAQLRKQTAKKAYDASTSSQAYTALVQVVRPASSATSDFTRYLQLFGFAGFAAGVGIGLALALLREKRLQRRRLGF